MIIVNISNHLLPQMLKNPYNLLLTKNTSALPGNQGWELCLAASQGRDYRVAQIDDYAKFTREGFLHRQAEFSLRARVSAPALPGTWGFGFWNDPFSIALTPPRLPCLPNACWFFYASPENHLTFTDDQPGSGLLAQVFRSPRIPSIFSLLTLPALPLVLIKPLARRMRQWAGKIIHQQGKRLELDPTGWHEYRLGWSPSGVTFRVDGELIFESPLAPRGPLGLVIWIDNQFMAWQPDGSLRAGTLPNPAMKLEITDPVIK